MEARHTPYGPVHDNRTTNNSTVKPVPPDVQRVDPGMTMAEMVNRRYDTDGRLLGPKEE
jgi:hypothetical protein